MDSGGLHLDSRGFSFALTLNTSEKQNCRKDKGLAFYALLAVLLLFLGLPKMFLRII